MSTLTQPWWPYRIDLAEVVIDEVVHLIGLAGEGPHLFARHRHLPAAR